MKIMYRVIVHTTVVISCMVHDVMMVHQHIQHFEGGLMVGCWMINRYLLYYLFIC